MPVHRVVFQRVRNLFRVGKRLVDGGHLRENNGIDLNSERKTNGSPKIKSLNTPLYASTFQSHIDAPTAIDSREQDFR